jgi:hypothetical protein
LKNEYLAAIFTAGLVSCLVILFRILIKEHNSSLRAVQRARAERTLHNELTELRMELQEAEKQVWLADDDHIGAAYYHLLAAREKIDAFVKMHRAADKGGAVNA